MQEWKHNLPDKKTGKTKSEAILKRSNIFFLNYIRELRIAKYTAIGIRIMLDNLLRAE